MYAAPAPLVSAIRANYHASANARANDNEAANAANCTIESTCRFEEAVITNNNNDKGSANNKSSVN